MQLTFFWNDNRERWDASDYVTLLFREDGTILRLTRDEPRSVKRTWEYAGTYGTQAGRKFIRFAYFSGCPKNWNAQNTVAGTHLARNGWKVDGNVTLWDDSPASVGRKTGDVTYPGTLLGRNRKRSLDLHDTGHGERGASHFGRRGYADVTLMAETIRLNKLARK